MKPYYLLLLSLITCLSCMQNKVDLEAEKKSIMALHHEQRRAHMEKNVSLLFKDSLADYIEVNRGFVKKPGFKETRERFSSYFDAVDFIKWDDVSEPVISISDDGTMATTVVEKLVITRDKTKNSLPDTTHYAWLAVYRKVNGKWQLHRMGSTSRDL